MIRCTFIFFVVVTCATMLMAGDPGEYLSSNSSLEGQQQAAYFRHWDYIQYFPNFDYALRGYDVKKAYPNGIGYDPGLTYPIFKVVYSDENLTADRQFGVPNGFLVLPDVSCRLSFTTEEITTENELKSYLSAEIGGEIGYSNLFKFSLNGEYQKSVEDINRKQSVYIMSSAFCQYYTSKLNGRGLPPFDDEFINYAMEMQADDITPNDIQQFIDYYGTHYMSQVSFGAKFIYQSKLSQSSYNKLKSNNMKIKMEANLFVYMEATGNYELGNSATGHFSQEIEETKTVTIGASPPPDGDADTWAYYVKKSPLPIKYKLTPINNLFTAPFMKHYPDIDHKKIYKRITDVLYNGTTQDEDQLLKEVSILPRKAKEQGSREVSSSPQKDESKTLKGPDILFFKGIEIKGRTNMARKYSDMSQVDKKHYSQDPIQFCRTESIRDDKCLFSHAYERHGWFTTIRCACYYDTEASFGSGEEETESTINMENIASLRQKLKLEDTEFTGAQIENIITGVSEQECVDRCIDDAECASVNYHVRNCKLFSASEQSKIRLSKKNGRSAIFVPRY